VFDGVEWCIIFCVLRGVCIIFEVVQFIYYVICSYFMAHVGDLQWSRVGVNQQLKGPHQFLGTAIVARLLVIVFLCLGVQMGPGCWMICTF